MPPMSVQGRAGAFLAASPTPELPSRRVPPFFNGPPPAFPPPLSQVLGHILCLFWVNEQAYRHTAGPVACCLSGGGQECAMKLIRVP